MSIVDLLRKAFIGGEWAVGYKKLGTSQYSIVPVDNGWIADPFLFENNGEHFLFVEYVKKDKGEIAYYKFINDKPVFQKVIISETYHLSYPCIFTYNNAIYMIPESADNYSIDLYKAIDFPEKWEKKCQLIKGKFYDSTYLNYDGNNFIFSYTHVNGKYSLCVFLLENDLQGVTQIAEKTYNKNIGRPAGAVFLENGKLMRPAQDCSRKYGERVLINSIIALEHDKYIEQTEKTICSSDINKQYQRVHTYNRDTVYEVVDLFMEKVNLYRPIKLLKKIAKQNMK